MINKFRSIQFYFRYNSEENNQLELYIDLLDEFSFIDLKDELKEILDIPNISDEHLQVKIVGPRIIKAFKKLETEKRRTNGCIMVLLGYA